MFRLGLTVVVFVVGLLGLAPIVDRALQNRGESSAIGQAMRTYRDAGCEVCHGATGAATRWRHDGRPVRDREVISNALVEGRRLAPGFPAAMPVYGTRLTNLELQRAVLAASVLAGVTAHPRDSALQIGREVARDMACFRCHGPAGSGGIGNLHSRRGSIPGFHGRAFAAADSSPGGLEGIIRSGRAADRAWGAPWRRPALDMPAYAGRIDSVEMGLLTRYLRWLNAQELE